MLTDTYSGRQAGRQAHANKCLIKQSVSAPGAHRKIDRHGREEKMMKNYYYKKQKKNYMKEGNRDRAQQLYMRVFYQH